jgi:hypothetical protein
MHIKNIMTTGIPAALVIKPRREHNNHHNNHNNSHHKKKHNKHPKHNKKHNNHNNKHNTKKPTLKTIPIHNQKRFFLLESAAIINLAG